MQVKNWHWYPQPKILIILRNSARTLVKDSEIYTLKRKLASPSEILRKFGGSLGKLSEYAQEKTNKIVRKVRLEDYEKTSSLDEMEDLIH